MKNKMIMLCLLVFGVLLQAAPQFETVSTATQPSREQFITISLPAGTVENDLMIATISTDGVETIVAPSGWILVKQDNNTTVTLAVFYRVATASEPADYTFTWGSNEQAAGAILRYSGADINDPIDVSVIATGNSETPTAPDATTTVDDTRIVRIMGADDDDLPIGAPSGHDMRIELASGSGSGTISLGAADRTQALAGDTGPASFSLDTIINENWVAVTLAIKPAVDTDGDGVPDDIDVDDDNDGVLDTVEGKVINNNGDFSEPPMTSTTWQLVDQADVPTWQTTASDGKIEFWNDGFQGVPAHSGTQFVEINANVVASLYQVFDTVPGETVEWSVAHRGRNSSSGIDVDEANMSIGPDGGPYVVINTMTTDDTAWVVYHGSYTVPAGQTSTRISFDSVSSSNGIASYGNLLDSLELYHSDYDGEGDGVPNRIDLDSDNDGIPDNVEAQLTSNTILARYPIVDTDGNGLDDQYETTPGSGEGLTPTDSDSDSISDYLDDDSDNDLITDCVEGVHPNITTSSKLCPVANNTVGTNGLVNWAENNDDYTEPNGVVTDPNPDTASDMLDEISSNSEAAYREAACGPAEVNLTAFQWKTVSFPCDLGTNDLEAIIGGANGLGTYGDNANWVMYEQIAPDFTGDRNTMHLMVNGTDYIEAGKGYWIIADSTKNVRINRPLSGIAQTYTTDANLTLVPPYYDQNSAAFEKIMAYQLPSSSDTDFRKVMLGNPFFKSYNLSDMYLSNNGAPYVSLSGFLPGSTIEPIVYIKDSTDTTTGNYIALDPGGTPGFGDRVPVMQGFWIKLNAGNSNTNTITFPFEK